MAAKASVKIKYSVPVLPTGSYTSAKIAYKKDVAPTSVKDADDFINVDVAENIVKLDGLDDSAQYYFVLYTVDSTGNKMESAPYLFVTGTGAEVEEGIVIFDNGQILRPEFLSLENPVIQTYDIEPQSTTVTYGWSLEPDGIVFTMNKNGISFQEKESRVYIGFHDAPALATDSPYTTGSGSAVYENTIKVLYDSYIEIDDALERNNTGSRGSIGWHIHQNDTIGPVQLVERNDIIASGGYIKNERNNKIMTRKYYDQTSTDVNLLYYVYLSYSLDNIPGWGGTFLHYANFYLKIKRIVIKPDKYLYPYESDTFEVYSESANDNAEWNIKEIMHAVKLLNYNSFIIRYHVVFPFNLTDRTDMITKRDGKIDNSLRGSVSIAIKNFGDINSLEAYTAIDLNSKELVKASDTPSISWLEDQPLITSGDFKYINPISNLFTPMVFYTDVKYINYYINDVKII